MTLAQCKAGQKRTPKKRQEWRLISGTRVMRTRKALHQRGFSEPFANCALGTVNTTPHHAPEDAADA
ncbi:hypothetical protein Hypma_001448 [Hypsizygus marmoreus]|uniref:Uncharacterized protein n=1 Tax=Hypsizygus marmoreus TaxID=39966 RepID=A0A369KB01_HYPMA|nr:hypothetical protein Hypma_001448 [Hypsizygus marmoreus]